MADEIFINYRRSDGCYIAHLLAWHLRAEFEKEAVFLDVDCIEAGADFERRLSVKLGRAKALVAVIGDKWLEEGPTGKPRLFDDGDYVRREIAKALERKIHIFPVLQHEVKLPQELPPDIEGLRKPNYVELHPDRVPDDIRKLVGDMRQRLSQPMSEVGPLSDAPLEPETRRARGRFAVSLCPAPLREVHWMHPGADFREMPAAPLMVVLPPGQLEMGASRGDPDAGPEEEQPHPVRIERQFALARHPVSVEEWNAFAKECPQAGTLISFKSERDRSGPVVGISWEQAQAYVDWLSKRTEQDYRLPSEAEWEYAARAGTHTRYWWGDTVTELDATRSLDAAGRFPANPWGLCGMLGSVSQWVEDDWHPNYVGAPGNAKPWRAFKSTLKVVRGGSWKSPAKQSRCSSRIGFNQTERIDHVGFRVARSLVDS